MKLTADGKLAMALAMRPAITLDSHGDQRRAFIGFLDDTPIFACDDKGEIPLEEAYLLGDSE